MVRKQWKRQMKPLCRSPLVLGILDRQAEEMFRSSFTQLGEMIPEGAGLRRAAACARYHVPAVRQRLVRFTRPWIDIYDGRAVELRQIDVGT